MKAVRILFSIMIAAVSLQGATLAAQASSAPQQAPAQSSEKSADQQKDEVRNEKDQARPKEADQSQEQSASVTRITTKRRPSASQSKPVPSHQPRPAKTPTTNSPHTDTPGSGAAPEQTGSKAVTNVPNKAVSRRPSAPPSAVPLNGQQFKNSRDPGARLAVSGGPPTSPRGTAAINGTNMKHKP